MTSLIGKIGKGFSIMNLADENGEQHPIAKFTLEVPCMTVNGERKMHPYIVYAGIKAIDRITPDQTVYLEGTTVGIEEVGDKIFPVINCRNFQRIVKPHTENRLTVEYEDEDQELAWEDED